MKKYKSYTNQVLDKYWRKCALTKSGIELASQLQRSKYIMSAKILSYLLPIILVLSCNRESIQPNDFYVKIYGGEHNQAAFDLQPFRDGYLLVGNTASGDSTDDTDMWVVHTDPSGNERWATRVGDDGVNEVGKRIQILPNNTLLLAGEAETELGNRIQLATLDFEGNLLNRQFVQRPSANFNDTLADICLRVNTDEIFLLGTTSKVNNSKFNPVTIDPTDILLMKTNTSLEGGAIDSIRPFPETYGFSHIDRGTKMLKHPAGGYLILGTTTNTYPDLSKFMLIHINEFGIPLNQRTYGTSGKAVAEDMVFTDEGNVLLIGSSKNGFTNIFGVEVSTNDLGELSNFTLSSNNNQEAYNMYNVQAENAYIITGKTNASSGDEDIYVVKIDHQGAIIWEKTFGGFGNDEGRAIMESEAGNIFITGTLSFGNNTVLSFLKLNANGELLPQ